MASMESQILDFIDIPRFSNDLRSVVLRYMYHRHITMINTTGTFLCLDVHLENKELSLRITINDNKFSRVLSSFGTYCDEKAINEYNKIKKHILNNTSSVVNWKTDRVLFTDYVEFNGNEYVFHSIDDIERSSATFHCLYAFCPDVKSTVWVQIHHIKGLDNAIELSYHYTDSTSVFETTQGPGIRYEWKSNNSTCNWAYRDIEETIVQMLTFYQLILLHGSKWHEHHSVEMGALYPAVMYETFCNNKHTLRFIHEN